MRTGFCIFCGLESEFLKLVLEERVVDFSGSAFETLSFGICLLKEVGRELMPVEFERVGEGLKFGSVSVESVMALAFKR